MLHEFAEPNATGVGAHRNTELFGHQVHGDDLVRPRKACRIELAEVDRFGLEHLLEEHPVHAVLTRRNANGGNRLADSSMTEHVIRACRFFNPQRIKLSERFHPVNGLVDVPNLVGVDHELRVGTDHFAGNTAATDVLLEIRTDLQFDVAVAGIHGLLAESAKLLIGVAQPASTGRVAGVTRLGEFGDALLLGRGKFAQHRDGVFFGERVSEVLKVCGVDELLGGHVGEQTPERLVSAASSKVPDGVHHGGHRQVFDTLFWSEPAQLRVRLQLAVNATEVADNLINIPADKGHCALLSCENTDVITAANRESEAVARDALFVSAEYDIGRRVVAIFVHCI